MPAIKPKPSPLKSSAPRPSAVGDAKLSPAEAVLEMIEDILEQEAMKASDKLSCLRELCVERITFESPQQATRIIAKLAEIIETARDPQIRVAALEAMERMVQLEQKAEAEGAPALDWRKVDLMLRKAKQTTAIDTVPVASRAGAPFPETPEPLMDASAAPVAKAAAQPVTKLDANAVAAFADDAPEAHAVSSEDISLTEEEAAILSVQQKAVDNIKNADNVTVPSTVKQEAAPAAAAPAAAPTVAPKDEPPIMQFLRSIAGNDEEENIRVLAQKVISRMENTTPKEAPPIPAAAAPALKEG